MTEITNLARCRIERGFTQEKLADVSGVPKQTLQKYEERKRNFDTAKFTTVLNIAAALEVPMYVLFDNKETITKIKWLEARTRR